MTKAVRVPKIRWIMLGMVLFIIFYVPFVWGFWNESSGSAAQKLLSPLIVSVSLLMSAMICWLSARQLKPVQITIPLSLETSRPLTDSAAAQMNHTVERLDTGEIVLRNSRAILGSHPTIVVRPESSTTVHIEGSKKQVASLAFLLTGQRLETDWEPSLWEVIIPLFLGVFIFVMEVIPPFRSCASISIPTNGPASVIGYSMRRLCDLWGPIVPGTINALIAMLPIAYAVVAWREYKKRKRRHSSS